MSEPSSVSGRLDALAEEFVQRHHRGERPTIDEYVARYPELADAIRDLFPALALMQNVMPEPGAATGPYLGNRGGPSPLERLGDYRILREVGRGGMGIVYEAEQESLGRHVALKVLPSHALLDAQRLQRFQREAKAAARLHHTNIVPVYGVGAQDGLHYYVMQFIQGLALDEVLAELEKLRHLKDMPSTTAHEGNLSKRNAHFSDISAVEVAHALLTGEFSQGPASGGHQPLGASSPEGAKERGADAPRSPNSSVRLPGPSGHSSLSESGRQYWLSVARIGIQVAEALAYAHGQGTLHRDIKPSNLLLDTHGTVWVTDFGLAKAADSADLTEAGDIVGTLRYMAPERFLGHADPRSDLYALGLTLYELLTLRPAFGAGDRHKLIDQVKNDEPMRPGKVDPSVPRDLETVVLKAMAKEPGHRYATAGELAEDLRRFVEDKPIQARRVGQAERLWRWCRRNRAIALASGIAAAALLVATAVAIVFAVYQATSVDKLAQAAMDLEEEKSRADERRLLAERRLAENYLDRGLGLCDQGDVARGMLWLATSLKSIPVGNDALERAVRANLGFWSQRLPTVKQ
jgi:serine/threonine protein kinase